MGDKNERKESVNLKIEQKKLHNLKNRKILEKKTSRICGTIK